MTRLQAVTVIVQFLRAVRGIKNKVYFDTLLHKWVNPLPTYVTDNLGEDATLGDLIDILARPK